MAMSLKNARKEIQKAAAKRPADILDNPRNVKSIRLINGMEVIIQEKLSSTVQGGGATSEQVGYSGANTGIKMGHSVRNRYWEGGTYGDDEMDDWHQEEPSPEHEGIGVSAADDEIAEDKDTGKAMRAAALETMYAQEVPEDVVSTCTMPGYSREATFNCSDCDLPGLFCRECLCSYHQFLPFHRPLEWTGEFLMRRTLSELGVILVMGHQGEICPHVASESGPQKLLIADVNGLHEVVVGWCRCASSQTFAKQLFERRLFPASMDRPRTAFTFRLMKQFHMLTNVARTTPWDFVGTLHRLTEALDLQETQDIYKPFKYVQQRTPGELAFPCVSCPLPGINLDSDWEKHPDSELIHTMFIGGDGNFRLHRHHKGRGEVVDPSLFGDDAFYAPNEKYKEFCRIRGGAPDDLADITCRGMKAGDPAKVANSHNKATSGCMCTSCLRSGALFPMGTVDLALGERFVNFDFALTHVLSDILKRGLKRVVISYDIACKYHIHFKKRIANGDYPLLKPKERRQLNERNIIWLVPKFHLAAHIEECADKFSFNWTKNVGRTSGESMETIWASLNGLATATREMGFGHRRDTIADAMNALNFRKAIGEAHQILKLFEKGVMMLNKKRELMESLETALGEEIVSGLREEKNMAEGAQYRPQVIDEPSKMEILKRMQAEETDATGGDGTQKPGLRSGRMTGCVGINIGLELEIKQQNLRTKLAERRNPTTRQELDLEETSRKMSKALEAWFSNLHDFLPADALGRCP
ncbi:hypothetical protein M422DRAFT_265273 [Sphaerobolus stellatus SS14]|uniref:CxC2-like cysteine cluster KDZ transposase-associated domain-containing protein n=1 Tax=Sphaerobolus stellatus (strain SS14) TaxID=990650 RepID=A0A0C9UUM5_SPHS4|nr:hypothetical protein M422DRAFT_265273 [Sphaerobolus stellatus SS14]